MLFFSDVDEDDNAEPAVEKGDGEQSTVEDADWEESKDETDKG